MNSNINKIKQDECEGKGEVCPMKLVQGMIAGKWKVLILWYLRDGQKRFSELQRLMPLTSKGVLTQQLKQLESDKLIHREVFNEVPPRVEYSLTEIGERFNDVLDCMGKFGREYLEINKADEEVVNEQRV